MLVDQADRILVMAVHLNRPRHTHDTALCRPLARFLEAIRLDHHYDRVEPLIHEP